MITFEDHIATVRTRSAERRSDQSSRQDLSKNFSRYLHTHAETRSNNIQPYNIRFGFKASNRGRKTNPRRESAGRKRFNSMKSRHERVFSPLLDLFAFQRSSLEPEIDEKIEVSRESARLSRTFNDNKMARRSADVSYSFPIRLRFPLSRKRHECDLEMTCNSWTSFSFFIFLHFFFIELF